MSILWNFPSNVFFLSSGNDYCLDIMICVFRPILFYSFVEVGIKYNTSFIFSPSACVLSLSVYTCGSQSRLHLEMWMDKRFTWNPWNGHDFAIFYSSYNSRIIKIVLGMKWSMFYENIEKGITFPVRSELSQLADICPQISKCQTLMRQAWHCFHLL